MTTLIQNPGLPNTRVIMVDIIRNTLFAIESSYEGVNKFPILQAATIIKISSLYAPREIAISPKGKPQ